MDTTYNKNLAKADKLWVLFATSDSKGDVGSQKSEWEKQRGLCWAARTVLSIGPMRTVFSSETPYSHKATQKL